MAPPQDMEMKVEHALAAMRTGIDDDTIPGIGNPLQFRNFVAGQQQTSEEPNIRILQFGHRRDMFSGNDERVRRRLGIDIVERDHRIIFIDQGCGNSPRDDFAKETFTHVVGPFFKPDFPNLAASS